MLVATNERVYDAECEPDRYVIKTDRGDVVLSPGQFGALFEVLDNEPTGQEQASG